MPPFVINVIYPLYFILFHIPVKYLFIYLFICLLDKQSGGGNVTDSLELSCTFEGFPRPNITWMFQVRIPLKDWVCTNAQMVLKFLAFSVIR
jgi:hypothetical protein